MPSVVMYAPLVLLVGAMVLSEEPPGPCPVVEGTEAANHTEAPLGAGLPVWTFCLYVERSSEVLRLDSIEVVETSSGRRLGKLPFPAEIKDGLGTFSPLAFAQAGVRPQFLDLDFDGYLDVRLLSFVGGSGNSGSNYWLFDPQANRFVFQRRLSGTRLILDPKNKVFTSYWEMEPGIYGLTTYRWIDGTPTVFRDETRNWDEERRCYDSRIRELREGVLVETVRNCFPELLPPGR